MKNTDGLQSLNEIMHEQYILTDDSGKIIHESSDLANMDSFIVLEMRDRRGIFHIKDGRRNIILRTIRNT